MAANTQIHDCSLIKLFQGQYKDGEFGAEVNNNIKTI